MRKRIEDEIGERHKLNCDLATGRIYKIFVEIGIPRCARDCGEILVEAAGVEPASENVTGQEPTYLVQFPRRELPRHIRRVRLERTRNASS